MKRNVGALDRMIRLTIGLICIYLTVFPTAFLSNDILRVFVAVFGVGNVVVSLLSFCPLYIFANINTHKRRQDKLAASLSPEDNP